MEEHASNRWTDSSLVCIIRRIVKEIPTVIAAGLIAAMLTVAYLQVFYKPQYTASTTVAVGMKNASYTSVFSNLSSTPFTTLMLPSSSTLTVVGSTARCFQPYQRKSWALKS